VKIAIDISCLNSNTRGFVRYVLGLLEGLAVLDHEHEIVLFSPGGTAQKQIANDFNIIGPSKGEWRFRTIWREFQMRRLATKHGVDLVHFPVSESWLAPCKTPWIITLHDISPVLYPQWKIASRPIQAYMHAVLKAIARSNAHVITVSERSRMDILEYTGLSEDRVHCVYSGMGVRHSQHPQNHDNEKQANNEPPYLLFVGAIEPRKNIGRMLEAFAKATQKHHNVQLILASRATPAQLHQVMHQADRLDISNQVKVITDVSDNALDALYRGSAGLLFATLYEAFGFPCLEAACRKVPVLISRGSACEEILNGHAVLADPLDVDDIAAGIGRLLGGVSNEIITNAHARSLSFSWKQCAADTLAIYGRTT